MNSGIIYCLDSNVLIEAWNKYYSPKFCPAYWDILNKLGKEEIIFIPTAVAEEIIRTEDELSGWLRKSDIKIHHDTEIVIQKLQDIYASNPIHQRLVDSTKQRSLADPWVIAHAMAQNAVVVTKEELVTDVRSKRVKIPNVCDNMNVRWINAFEFIGELNIKFSCEI